MKCTGRLVFFLSEGNGQVSREAGTIVVWFWVLEKLRSEMNMVKSVTAVYLVLQLYLWFMVIFSFHSHLQLLLNTGPT